MFPAFLVPGVCPEFYELSGRSGVRPSVPNSAFTAPGTLKGGQGGSVAFLAVLIVEQERIGKSDCGHVSVQSRPNFFHRPRYSWSSDSSNAALDHVMAPDLAATSVGSVFWQVTAVNVIFS